MITKAEILAIAKRQELQPTTIEKDYVLGWLLFAIANHNRLSHWVFKGGTCLKKCFFETYRFSEDLDFTIPPGEQLDEQAIVTGLVEVVEWIEVEAGIHFPRDGIGGEGYENKRGRQSYQAKVTYVGPLNLPRRQLQRAKFDLTQDEVIADSVDQRQVFHPYGDAIEPLPAVNCYSVNEILAEKTRALYERQGRARDVYDLVHLSRNFREIIKPEMGRELLRTKFAFKELPEPTVDLIMGRVDADVLRANWNDQLAHQLPALPPVDEFLLELNDAIAWWLQPASVTESLPQIPTKAGEQPVPKRFFPSTSEYIPRGAGGISTGDGSLSYIRYAARNHLCARIVYHSIPRIVEPYSLRRPKTGNTLLYAYELRRGNASGNGIKAFQLDKIQSISVTDQPFRPRFTVEL